MDPEEVHVLDYCLFQYSGERMKEVTPDTRFAHYTSAETAMRIIQDAPENRSLWLRNSWEMNDFSEVRFGQDCLLHSLHNNPKLYDRFRATVNDVHPDILPELGRALDEERHRIKDNTYLLSLALHGLSGRRHGLLSMWRAYGGDANVCLIFNTGPFTRPQEAYDVVLSPVLYGGVEDFDREIGLIATRMAERKDDLRKIDKDIVGFNLKRAIDFAMLSMKHPGFVEENEWRVIYRPPDPPGVPDVPSKIVCLNGIVQRVFYIPMTNKPDKGVTGAELHEILDGIVIGPTPNPGLVCRAFVDLLYEAGFPDAEKKVTYCEVPLRR